MNRDKRKKAAALKYDPEIENAPRITAKGRGAVAEKIIEIAEQHNVPVHEDPDLVEVLSGLDLDEEIPQDVYVAVAELLAFVYSINKTRLKR
ncbi:MAG: flagellar biosynthesis protein FlhB [Desulfobacteraceae bacterium]|nr:flagellar biosynthesis protein FlhB [Desulfobacteraceae bacterium]